jgi:hypothetical protein
MPYFAAIIPGDRFNPATEARIYQNDTQIVVAAAHARNNQRGQQIQSRVPGAFALGKAALGDPKICCDNTATRAYVFFDGTTQRNIPESVWRQAAGIPPFVDSPIPPH